MNKYASAIVQIVPYGYAPDDHVAGRRLVLLQLAQAEFAPGRLSLK